VRCRCGQRRLLHKEAPEASGLDEDLGRHKRSDPRLVRSRTGFRAETRQSCLSRALASRSSWTRAYETLNSQPGPDRLSPASIDEHEGARFVEHELEAWYSLSLAAGAHSGGGGPDRGALDQRSTGWVNRQVAERGAGHR
jgi:hypothetical protein